MKNALMIIGIVVAAIVLLMIVGAVVYFVIAKSMFKTFSKATKDMFDEFDDEDWR